MEQWPPSQEPHTQQHAQQPSFLQEPSVLLLSASPQSLQDLQDLWRRFQAARKGARLGIVCAALLLILTLCGMIATVSLH